MSEWIGVVNSTAPKYLKGAQDLTIRNRLHLALLRDRGRIKLNEAGSYQCTWTVHFAEQPVESYGDAGSISFERHDLLKQLTLDWRAYKATDMMTEKEKLMNRGDVAIVERYGRIMPTLMQSITNKFGGELLIDGNATGNGNRLHGIESFMGSGTTVAADRVAKPSDTYAGLSTELGGISGTWSANLATFPNANVAKDWPDGSGDPEFDFLSPKLINWSSNGWGTGATTWEANCERVLQQATIWSSRTAGKEGRPTVYLLASNLYYGFQAAQLAKQRITVPHREAQDLGFGETLNQDGVMITHDFDVPVNTGYGLNVNQMELASLGPQLFGSKGPTYDIRTDSYLFIIGFFGNCRYQPKYFSKLYNYA